MWNDYGFIRPGRAPDYGKNPVTPPIPPIPPIPPVNTLTATITLDNVPIGAAFAEIGTDLIGTITYSLITNPSHLFSLSGNLIEVAGVLTAGSTYVIGVRATNGTTAQTATLTVICLSVTSSFAIGARAFTPDSPVNSLLSDWQPVIQFWPCNMPVGNTTHAPFGFQNYFAGIKFQALCQPPSTEPIVTFSAPASWGNPLVTFNEPQNPGFTGNGDPPDNEAIYIDSQANIQSLYNYTRISNSSASVSSYALSNVINQNGFGNPLTGQGAGTVAAGTSNYLGCLIKEEVLKGSIDHFLAMGILGNGQVPNLCNPGHYTPAISGDGNSTNGCIMEGQMMAIPPGAALPGGLSQWGAILFTTMMNYGVFVHDTSGSIVFYGVDDYANPSNNWTAGDITELISDMNILAPKLAKVGCYLDGLQSVIGAKFQCGPRLPLISYTGQIVAGTLTSGGASYQPGTYTSVPIGVGQGGLGQPLVAQNALGAAATIVVGAGGSVTSVTPTAPGFNFSVGDVLTAPSNSIGNLGSGLKWTVTAVNTPVCLTVARDSDSTSQAISYVNGFLDTTTMATFCSGTTGRVSGYNDSISNFGAAAPTGTAPIIFQSGAPVTLGGKPAILFDGTSNVLKIPSSSSINPVPNGKLFYFCATVQVADHTGNYGLFGSDATGGLEVRIEATNGFVQILLNNGTSIGASTTEVALNTPTCIEATYNPQTGAFVIFQNRAQTATGTNLQSITAGNVLMGAGGTGVDLFKGLIGDVLICASPSDPFPNISQYTINVGAQQYWGTP